MKIHIYTKEEQDILLLPKDKAEIKKAMFEDKFTNNMFIDILDKRQAEFNELTKDCETDIEKLHKWNVENKLTLIGLEEDSEPQLCSDEPLTNDDKLDFYKETMND